MDSMQKWLDELTIIHLGCIVEYGQDGRLNFIDVPNNGENKLSLENDFEDQSNQNYFISKTHFTENERAGERIDIAGSPAQKAFNIKKMEKVRNASNKIEKKKNKKKGKKNKITPLNVEASQPEKLQSRFDHRLQMLDELVSKMPAPERRELGTTESQLNVGLVKRKHRKRMRLEGGYLSPIPEETLEYTESSTKKEKNILTKLFSKKKLGVAPQHKENNSNKILHSKNSCAPVLNEKLNPQREVKAQWSKLKLPSLLGKTKKEQNLIKPKLHVRKVARYTTPSIFPRFFLKQNKVRPIVC